MLQNNARLKSLIVNNPSFNYSEFATIRSQGINHMPTKELKTYTLAEMKDKYIGKVGTSTSAMFLQSFAELCGGFTEVLSPPKSHSRTVVVSTPLNERLGLQSRATLAGFLKKQYLCV